MIQQATPINSTLWQVIDSLNLRDDIINRFIKKYWIPVLGPTLAKHGEYQGYHDFVIIINADNLTWLKEFKLLEQDIIAKFNDYLGANFIRRIQITAPTYGDKKEVKKRRGKTSSKRINNSRGLSS